MRDRETKHDVLRAVRERVVAWRGRHGGRGRAIPAELWGEAVAVARTEGVERTARELSLDRRRLARLVNAASAPLARASVVAAPADVGFVELDAEVVCARGRTLVRLESRDGERVQIEMSSGTTADALALARAFWSRIRCCS